MPYQREKPGLDCEVFIYLIELCRLLLKRF